MTGSNRTISVPGDAVALHTSLHVHVLAMLQGQLSRKLVPLRLQLGSVSIFGSNIVPE